MKRRALLLGLSGVFSACASSGGDSASGSSSSANKGASAFPPEIRDVLTQATTMEILTVHPRPTASLTSGVAPGPQFHGYAITGRAPLTDAAEQKQLVELVERGIAENKGLAAACFNPRHGISAKKGDATVDVLICYECLSLKVYTMSEAGKSFLTEKSVEGAVNDLFKAKGLTISG